jgi:NifU-like protein involved in Fe-S cluster formation
VVTERLRQVMLAAEGAGELAGVGVARGRAEHPVCGDVVRVDLRLRGGRIAALAWGARGCPACVAVAAAAPAALCGAPLAEAAPRLRRRLDELGGLAAHEQHAEQLLLRALAAAVPEQR